MDTGRVLVLPVFSISCSGVTEVRLLPGLFCLFQQSVPHKERAKAFAALLCVRQWPTSLPGRWPEPDKLDGLFARRMAGLARHGRRSGTDFRLLALGILTNSRMPRTGERGGKSRARGADGRAREAAHLGGRSTLFHRCCTTPISEGLIGFFLHATHRLRHAAVVSQMIRSLGQIRPPPADRYFCGPGPLCAGDGLMVLCGPAIPDRTRAQAHYSWRPGGAIGSRECARRHYGYGYVGLCIAAIGISGTFSSVLGVRAITCRGPLRGGGGLAFHRQRRGPVAGAIISPYMVGLVRVARPLHRRTCAP